MIVSGHIAVRFAKKDYLDTQKTEFEHLHLKIHFCVGYPPLGEVFVEKWVVVKKKWNQQGLGIDKTFQKLFANLYCDDWDFHTVWKNC